MKLEYRSVKSNLFQKKHKQVYLFRMIAIIRKEYSEVSFLHFL